MLDFRYQFAQRHVPDKYYILRLQTLLSRAAKGSLPPHELFAEMSDDFWLWLNTEGMRRSPDLAQILPALPEESVQLNSNGIAGDLAMVDAFAIHRWVKAIFEAYVGDFSRCHSLLDFGVGWGRVIRFFLNCLDSSRLWGVDHYDLHIDIARKPISGASSN